MLNEQEILHYLRGKNDAELYSRAAKLKEEIFGPEVFLRGIVEFSNNCRNRCLYCGLRAPNRNIDRYRLDRKQILRAAALVVEMNFGTLVLQSGDDYHFTKDFVGDLVREIKERHDIAVTLSLGDRTPEEFTHWRACGADRYLIKLETTDEKLYEHCRPREKLSDRFRRIEYLQKLGYEVGSGVITGLPGMTDEILARDIMRLSTLGLDMIASGPFVPHADTPLGTEPFGSLEQAYRTTALLRLNNPEANIPATSALDSLAPDGRKIGLLRGCNVIMPSVTPEEVRKSYNIYPGKNSFSAGAMDNARAVKEMIKSLGLVPSSSKGFSPRREHDH